MPLPDPTSAASDDPEFRNLLKLSLVPGIGPRLSQALLERFESPAAVLAAKNSDLREVPGIGPKLADQICRAAREIDVERQLELCQQHGVRVLGRSHPDYPRSLREICDPPMVLFYRGTLLPQDGLAVAVIGSRHATYYGKTQAERLSSSLARAGLTVISGLARGIDAAAHRGALDAGGRTLSVMGGGLATIYPPEHQSLAEEVVGQGALITEFHMQSVPSKGNFPQRNRIISGLSLGVIVVEAAESSGALNTARHAMEQGRDVFAVPGPIDSRMSRGCHQLIREGAKLVESAEDVLEELGPLTHATPAAQGQVVHRPAELLLNDLESRVLAAVGSAPTAIDRVITTSGLPTSQVLSTLSVLEMRRLIRRQSGSLVVRL